MQRRNFLISSIAVASNFLFSKSILAQNENQSIILNNAYMLWYNRPSIAETKAGYIIAYTTQNGHLYATELSKALEIGQTVKLYSFENISDHSAPSIIKIQAGKYAGHLLFFFSNHASQLFFTRSLGPDTISDGIEEPKLLDEARVTYPAPYITREGAIGVQYTIQLEEKSNPAIQWRNTIHRMTSDGGDTWTTPKTILSYGHHQFPYTTPVATNNNGKLAIAFSIYSEKTQINHGLWILISNDNFTTSQKINAVTNVGFFSYIPYEIAWIDDDTLMLSYSAHEKKKKKKKPPHLNPSLLT